MTEDVTHGIWGDSAKDSIDRYTLCGIDTIDWKTVQADGDERVDCPACLSRMGMPALTESVTMTFGELKQLLGVS